MSPVASSLVLAALAAAPAPQDDRSRPLAADFAWLDRHRSPPEELGLVLAGGRVLATTTLRVLAFDAQTCELAWRSEKPAGWESLPAARRDGLLDGIGARDLRVAPASDGRVVVAALHTPSSVELLAEWQGIPVSKVLPERRLFAFDVASGRPLWHHAPEDATDLASAPFERRMRACGPPLVAGERVLVPCASELEAIDYHVACYELATGRLAWSASVARSESVPRNLFGHPVREFVAPPLAVAGERVLAVTGIGTIAALDLATGAVAWRVEHESLPHPRTRSYSPPSRASRWKSSAPLVCGDVLLAAPPDSSRVLALDLASGATLWTSELDAARGGPEELVAWDGERLLLGGSFVRALRLPGGPRATEREAAWTFTRTRAVGPVHAAGPELFVPTERALLALDAATGESRERTELERYRGMLVAGDALFVLDGSTLRRLAR